MFLLAFIADFFCGELDIMFSKSTSACERHVWVT